jgi:hypothetical protein
VGNDTALTATDKKKKNDLSTTGDLFDQFSDFSGISNLPDRNRHEFTHLTGLYDLIPKRVLKQGSEDSVVKRTLKTKFVDIDVEIKPAVFPGNKLIFPGMIEERVESALAYIASHGDSEIFHDTDGIQVFFTLKQVKRVLKQVMNKTYSLAQIKTSLKILNESPLNITPKDKSTSLAFNSTRLSNMIVHTQEQLNVLNETGDETRCSAVFHPLFSLDIQSGRYTLHDLKWQGELSFDLSETMYRHLSAHWRQASVEETYHFSALTFLAATAAGTSTSSNKARMWANVRKAVNELHDKDVITKPEEDIRYVFKDGAKTRKIEDILFEFKATERFQKMMIESNINQKRRRQKLANPT